MKNMFSGRLTPAPRRYGRMSLPVVVTTLGLMLAGCAPNALQLAPAAPDQPWAPAAEGEAPALASMPHSASAKDQTAAMQDNGHPPDFSIPANPELAQLQQPTQVDTKRSYGLAELIDIAQRNSPDTRTAWEKARQAALAVGMVEATYLPLITANVLAGGLQTSVPNPVPIVGSRHIELTAQGTSPVVAFEWLVFDFGQRAAVAKAAKEGSFAANVLFNAAHQQLILGVATAYYRHGAAVSALRLARQSQGNSNAVLAAVEAQLANGRATTVELAQARQQVAQSRLRVVTAEGQVRDAYQGVLTAMGVNATLPIKIRETERRALPARVDDTAESMIQLALSRRPDVVASYAALKASKAGIAAAEAEFMPKVFLSGAAGYNDTRFGMGNLPTAREQYTSSGILLGATVPIYDAGLRAAQLKNAQSQAAAMEQTFRKTQNAAVSEIVVASNVLRTALESYRAAGALAQAANTTYDAALDAYKNGLGTVTVVNEANTALLDARLAQTEAHAVSLISAVNLAFLTGSLTSRDDIGLPGVRN